MSHQYPQDPSLPPQQPQYPGGYQPQPQPYQAPPPGWMPPKPKKSHKFRNFVVFPLVGLIVIICIAVGAANNSGTSGSSGSAPLTKNDARPVTVGTAFTLGKHQLDAGWTLKFTQYIGTSVTGTVTNVSKSKSAAFFSIKFLKGAQVVANMQCSTNELEPGQQEAVECQSTVDGAANLLAAGAYDKVTAEATF